MSDWSAFAPAPGALPLAGLAQAFVAALLLQTALELWLAWRQRRHVLRHRAQVPAAFAQRITLAAHQRAADYTADTVRLGMWESALSALVLLAWTLGGGLDALNQALLRWMGPGLGQQLALMLAFGAISALLNLPLGLYKTFVIEQRHGFNQMSWALWLADALRAVLLGLLLGVPLLAALLWLMQAAGGLWWLWAWALWMGFNLLMLWLYPTWIAPLFNRFEPLADQALEERIRALMQASGFKAQGLFVMDGSRRSAHANAYFTGLGSAKRVVFFDTLLRKLDHGEIEAVLAHELGHFKHRHIAKRLALFALLSALGFAALGWLQQQPAFFTALGVTPQLDAQGGLLPQAHNALALLLFSIVAGVLGGLLQPLWAQLSRRHEFEADAYAARHSSAQHLAAALLKLYEDNAATLTPDPLYARFHYSHPPASERLARMGQQVQA